MIDYQQIIDLFASFAIPAAGVAITFALGTKIIRGFISMGLGGKFKL